MKLPLKIMILDLVQSKGQFIQDKKQNKLIQQEKVWILLYWLTVRDPKILDIKDSNHNVTVETVKIGVSRQKQKLKKTRFFTSR